MNTQKNKISEATGVAGDLIFGAWPTAWGPMGGVRGAAGLVRIELPHYSSDDLKALLQWETPGARLDNSAFADVAQLCQDYFNGKNIDFSTVNCDLSSIGPFGRKILGACRQIAYGQTRSYTQLAMMSGEGENKARAAAQALAKNPIPLIVPCHRVLAAGGGLGGFSAPGGVDTKKRTCWTWKSVRHPSRRIRIGPAARQTGYERALD